MPTAKSLIISRLYSLLTSAVRSIRSNRTCRYSTSFIQKSKLSLFHRLTQQPRASENPIIYSSQSTDSGSIPFSITIIIVNREIKINTHIKIIYSFITWLHKIERYCSMFFHPMNTRIIYYHKIYRAGAINFIRRIY
uniref:hypothetical protein n=1 Tax=Macalpinomyces bursus TaxID=882770 RepID=UPI001BED645A|nr:hypothetical protein MFW59_mgp25 [Macalpinomyces bursus]QUA00834.1 hypothetical protein [Macalpinomyces bursus]